MQLMHSHCQQEVQPFTAIVVMECTNVDLNTLYKLATHSGMSCHVFVVYAYAVAALVLLPSSFLSSRSRALLPLNFSILLKIVLLGVFGYTSQIMGYTGINDSSPTRALAMSNLVPTFTLVLALIFSVIGATVIAIGFYTVMWGKSKEEMVGFDETSDLESSSATLKHPLLQSHKAEDCNDW